MTDDKMTPEMLAEEWLKTPLNIANMESVPMGAFLCGYDAGYARGHQIGKSRGKAEAEKRIWEEAQNNSISFRIPERDENDRGIWLGSLKQIIFGGGDE